MNIKTFKRNAVLVAVVAFVGAAAWLNWSTARETEAARNLAEAQPVESAEEEGGLFYAVSQPEEPAAEETATPEPIAEEETEPVSLEDYFARVRLARTRARDEAAAALQTVAGSDAATEETVNAALTQMTEIADWSMREAELETMILAKGFTDCVVFLSDDAVTVTTAIDGGLTSADVARITDVILSETDYPADALRVVEIK